MPQQVNPLTKEHCRICNQVLASIPDALELANRCIDCGFPAQELRDTLLQQQAQATAIKRNFFPGEP